MLVWTIHPYPIREHLQRDGILYGPGPYYYGAGYPPPPAGYAPPPEGDISYCMQRYKSYDPNTGTFLGKDGRRHPCP